MKNVGESVLAKLRNQAKERRVDPQFLLNRYVLERFLYRLSVSEYSDTFALKGGLLVAVWNSGDLFRPTLDIDLNGFHEEGTIADLERAIRAIIATEVPDDGVMFDLSRLLIRKQREGFVPGGKIEFDAKVHTSNVRVRADVGFGNAITPGTEFREYPSLLDAPRPVVHMYPPETSIAEKLHAMARHGIVNTRLKDYYDIWLLRQRVDIDEGTLAEAIAKTFERHQTEVPDPFDLAALSDDYIRSKSKSWDNYVDDTDLAVSPPALSEVVEVVRTVLFPAIERAKIAGAALPAA